MEGNRGQISVFIVIGLIILIGSGLFIYLRSVQLEGAEEQLVGEFSPVSNFVEQCIEQVSRRGIEELGKQGGYISPEEFGFRFNENSPTSQFSDGVQLANNWKIPYWWHMKSANNCEVCEFGTNAPELSRRENFARTIEGQLDDYVETRLRGCTADFGTVKEFVVKERGDIEAKTTVAENEVIIEVSWPLIVSKEATEGQLSQFSARHKVRLKRMFELASMITVAQANYSFLDRHTMNVISLYSGIDKPLPPTTDTGYDVVNTNYWTRTNIMESLKQTFAANVPMLQVYNTGNYRRITVGGENRETRQRTLDNMILVLNEEDDFRPLTVSFDYLLWPIYFDINSKGELIFPDSISLPIFNFGVQHYNAVYDVSYPVMVTISDPDAFGGQGYDFIFALEANIRNNEPLKPTTIQLSAPETFEASLLCDLSQRNSGEITVLTEPGAAVMFTCIETCTIGSADEKGILKSKFPVCLGGRVSASKLDHITSSRQLSTSLGQRDGVEIPLAKIYEVQFDVRKKLLQRNVFDAAEKETWTFVASPVSLLQEESALVQLERKSEEDEPYLAVANYEPDKKGTIRIAPGTYDVTINVVSRRPLLIPEREECPDIGPCVRYPQLNLNTYQSGGAELKSIEITEDQLQSGNIVFYALSPDLEGIPQSSRKIDDIEIINKISELSQNYEAQLMPEFR